jgi:hypothetical protein
VELNIGRSANDFGTTLADIGQCRPMVPISANVGRSAFSQLEEAHDLWRLVRKVMADTLRDGTSARDDAAGSAAPKLPNLVEVFKNVFGKTMSSAVLENDLTTQRLQEDCQGNAN